jgi:hypothetical protein
MQSANRSAKTFGALQLIGGSFNDALYEGEDGCQQDTQTMSCVCNFARNARTVRAIFLEQLLKRDKR